MKNIKKAVCYALLAAALYALNMPLSKLLLPHVGATMMAALLYLGAGLGMALLALGSKLAVREGHQESLTRRELPYVIGMVVLDIAAPILLMFGLQLTNSANASLLNNFEIVATSLIALLVFREAVSRRLWLAITLVTVASAILTFESAAAFAFNRGSLLVLAAAACWGLENNCTKMISNKSSREIVMIKGIFSGLGSLVIAFAVGEALPGVKMVLAILLLGFVAYGLSIYFYVKAQNHLGAAKTSGYYSVAPFLGVAFSLLLLGEKPGWQFYLGLAIMAVSTILMVKDSLASGEE